MAVHVRVAPRRLRHRLDAMYYHPRFLANEERLTRSGTACRQVRELVSAGRRAVYFGTTTHEREAAPSTWVPFLTADDLGDDGFYLDPSPRRLVSPEFAARYPNGWLRPNEILVKVKGPNQIAAYNPTTSQFRTLVSGTLWGALVRNNVVDAHFLLTALSCPYAATARERLRTNTNVEFLAAEDLLTLELPYLKETKAQVYIGDKVRQAERLRECATFSRREAAAHFCGFDVSSIAVGAKKSYWTKRQHIDGKRLDPPFYDPGQIALAASLTAAGHQTLHCLASCVATKWRRKESACLYFDIGSLDVGTGMIEGRVVATHDAPSRAQQLVQPWDLLVSTVRPNRKNVALIPESVDSLPLVASTGFAVLRFGSPAEAVFYHAWLRTDASTHQLMRWNAGSAYPAIEGYAVTQVLAPSHEANTVVACGTRWLSGMKAQQYSGLLVIAAKYLVESLIDGKVTETDLVQAQEALERHERGPDRALLVRLTTHGLDVPDAKPLFPDLDRLNELLDQNVGEER